MVIGEARNFVGGDDWLAEHGVEVIDSTTRSASTCWPTFIARHPDVWNEDIGE